jgi:hypothetical protein
MAGLNAAQGKSQMVMWQAGRAILRVNQTALKAFDTGTLV